MKEPARHPSQLDPGGDPAGKRRRPTEGRRRRVRRATSGAPPGNPGEIHQAFRQLFRGLRVVERAEGIPLEYLAEALMLFVIKCGDTFTRVRPEAIADIHRRLGSEVVSAAKKQYCEDLLGDQRDRRKLARRATPRPTEAASAGVTSLVGDPAPAAASAGSLPPSRGGRPAPSASREGLARRRRRDGGR